MNKLNDDKINQEIIKYAKNLEEYKWSCDKVYNILNNFSLRCPKIVYSIKSRIKTAESLINKLRKKCHSNDIVGLRILYYFREDLPEVHKYIIENFHCKEIKIYTFDEDFFKNIFSPEECKKNEINLIFDTDKPKQSGYTGIHYIVYLKDADRQNHIEIPIEIQVKNLFEEAWGELEHDIGYKYPPMDIQTFFQGISEKLSLEYKTMIKLRAHIDNETKEFQKAIDNYYPNYIDVMEKGIKQLLIDLGVKVESASKKIREFDKLDSVYLKILPMDTQLESLKIVLRDYDINEQWKTEIESILLKTFFNKVLKEDSISQNEKDILREIFSDPKNLSKPLNILNNVLKEDLKITKFNGVDVVNDFLRRIWKKSDTEKFLVLEIIFRLWSSIKEKDLNGWKSSIKKYFKAIEEVRKKDKIIQIVKRSPITKDFLRRKYQQDLFNELRRLRG